MRKLVWEGWRTYLDLFRDTTNLITKSGFFSHFFINFFFHVQSTKYFLLRSYHFPYRSNCVLSCLKQLRSMYKDLCLRFCFVGTAASERAQAVSVNRERNQTQSHTHNSTGKKNLRQNSTCDILAREWARSSLHHCRNEFMKVPVMFLRNKICSV